MTRSNKLMTGLVAGALVGAAAGILLAPKPGKESRGIVGTKAGEIRNRTGAYIGTVREKIRRGRSTEIVEETSENGVQTYTWVPLGGC